MDKKICKNLLFSPNPLKYFVMSLRRGIRVSSFSFIFEIGNFVPYYFKL